MLFEHYPNWNEGQMTNARSHCDNNVSQCDKYIKFDQIILWVMGLI